MIPPTVGRKIWYRAGETDTRIPQLSVQPLDATVVHVNEDGTVNLALLGHDGSGPYARQNVVLVQEREEPAPGQACWMPFQKGQSAKVDEASEKLKALLDQGNSAKLIPPGGAPELDPEKSKPPQETPAPAELTAGQGQDPANAEQTTQAQPPEPAPQG